MTVSVIQRDPSVAYAAGEVVRFLNQYSNAAVLPTEGGERTVWLGVDPTMPAHCYAMEGDGRSLNLRGGSPSAVLCAACEALREGGILFEATGHAAPCGFDVDAFFGVRRAVTPKFRLRGIRQHINFPMDISSYSLSEAQEYVRALARMGYNAMTFHSYPGQWHAARPVPAEEGGDCAGHFFYGQVHPLPTDDPLLAARIHNRRYFCIPEAEAIFEEEARRAEFAVYWLNQVMATAKEAGMTVTLSVEILTDDGEAMVRMLRAILEDYPLMDTFELITEECGGFRDLPHLTREGLQDFLVELFGADILDEEGKVPNLPDSLPGQLGSSAVSLKRLLTAFDLRERWTEGLSRVPDLRAGLYLTCPDTLRVLRPILRRKRPADTTMSLLPAHGAVAVARNIRETGNLSEDWQNTMYYSWAEFDGNMFLQQMSTDGIEDLVGLPDADSAYGFCINHWRTAENTLAITYAAHGAVNAMTTAEFYPLYARQLGIGEEGGFTAACRRLAALDTYNRDNLFNIGFCAVNCWYAWHRRKGGMMPRGYAREPQRVAIAEYEAIAEAFGALLPTATTKEGTAFLRLMQNRCRTSVLHIRAMMVLDELTSLYDFEDPKPLDEGQMGRIRAILEESMTAARAYLDLYGEILPDRGGEGQLISYYETTVAYIRAVAASFTHAEVVSAPAYDGPPMPDAEVR